MNLEGRDCTVKYSINTQKGIHLGEGPDAGVWYTDKKNIAEVWSSLL